MIWFLSNSLDLVKNLNNFDLSWHFVESSATLDPPRILLNIREITVLLLLKNVRKKMAADAAKQAKVIFK